MGRSGYARGRQCLGCAALRAPWLFDENGDPQNPWSIYDGNGDSNIVYTPEADDDLAFDVPSVKVYGGLAIRYTGAISERHKSLLTISPTFYAFLGLGQRVFFPEWGGEEGDWTQGSLADHGRGGVYLSAETGMFTAYTDDDGRGFSDPEAPFNEAYTVNLMRLLSDYPTYKVQCEGEADGDGDGICDPSDNCLSGPNHDQRDPDGDGYGAICDADFNNDGVVGNPDLIILSAAYGTVDGDPAYDPNVDMDGDGVIAIRDYILYMQSSGQAPGPSGLSCAGTEPCPLP